MNILSSTFKITPPTPTHSDEHTSAGAVFLEKLKGL